MSAEVREKFLRITDVIGLVGLRRTTIYKMIRQGDFPEPIKFGRASLWTTEDVSEWQSRLLRKSNRRRFYDLEDLI